MSMTSLQSAPLAPSSSIAPIAASLELDPEPRLLLDANLVAEYLNPAARRLLQDRKISLHAAGHLQLWIPHATRVLEDLARRALKERRAQRRLIGAIDADRWLSATMVPSTGGDRLLTVTLHDIELGRPLDLSAATEAFRLTAAEIPILLELLNSFNAKEIARALGISVHTVRSHLRSIYARMNARSAVEAVRRALELSLNTQDTSSLTAVN